MDRFDDYHVLDSKFDRATGRYVELGRIYNFGYEAVEIAVYPDRDPARQSRNLHKQLIGVVNPRPYPETLEFDGSCYFIRTNLRKGWDWVDGKWPEPTGGNICVYVLTPDGQRIDHLDRG